jgi:hypothetical protein
VCVLYLLCAVRRPEPCTEVVPNFLEIVCGSHQNQTRTKRVGSITDDDVGLVETLVVASVENAAVERNEDCSVYCFENGHVVPRDKYIRTNQIRGRKSERASNIGGMMGTSFASKGSTNLTTC